MWTIYGQYHRRSNQSTSYKTSSREPGFCCGSSEIAVILPDLKDPQSIPNLGKILGIHKASMDHFHLTVTKLPPLEHVMQQTIYRIRCCKDFQCPLVVFPRSSKILGRQCTTHDSWLRWQAKLELLSCKLIPWYYFSKSADIASIQLHGFCDANHMQGCHLPLCDQLRWKHRSPTCVL